MTKKVALRSRSLSAPDIAANCSSAGTSVSKVIVTADLWPYGQFPKVTSSSVVEEMHAEMKMVKAAKISILFPFISLASFFLHPYNKKLLNYNRPEKNNCVNEGHIVHEKHKSCKKEKV